MRKIDEETDDGEEKHKRELHSSDEWFALTCDVSPVYKIGHPRPHWLACQATFSEISSRTTVVCQILASITS